MKIRGIAIDCRATNQFQLIGLGVPVKVIFEAEMAGSIEDKRKRVARSGINRDKPGDIRVG